MGNTNVQVEDEKQPEETVNDTVEETTEDFPEEILDETSDEILDEETETEKEEELEEEPKNKPTEQRPVYTMPVSKAQKEKKRAVEKAKKKVEEAMRTKYESKIAELQKASLDSKADDYEQEIDKFAEEEGLESGLVKKIVEFAQKPISSKLSKIDELMAEKEKEAILSQTSQEFDNKVVSLIQKDYPTATPKHIAEVKKKIVELAFTPEYNTYKLSDIYKVNKEEFAYKDNYSVEPSEGGTVKVIDFKSMTPQEEHKLAQENPEKFEKYIKWQEAQQSSYIDM